MPMFAWLSTGPDPFLFVFQCLIAFALPMLGPIWIVDGYVAASRWVHSRRRTGQKILKVFFIQEDQEWPEFQRLVLRRIK